MTDLTPREQAIVELAKGRPPLAVARELGVTEAAVRRVAMLLGWPGDTRALKRAASAIKAGQRLWAGDLDERPDDVSAVEAPPVPNECGGDSLCPASLHIHGCFADLDGSACDDPSDHQVHQGDAPMPTPLDDTEAILDLLDLTPSEPPPSDRATMTMPLARLVDVDGTETVLVEAVIEVQLVASQVLDALDDRSDVSPVCWTTERRLTPDGETAIRTLAALLSGGVR